MNYLNNLKSLEEVEVENRTLRMPTKYLRADNCGMGNRNTLLKLIQHVRI